jgi:DNA-binding NtrC family response regulator
MSRVLVVDDEEEVREAVKRRLEREGYEVVAAGSHAEAREILRKARPTFDVVVTDMVMESPDSGAQVLQDAVAQDIFTEVIILTAYGNVADAVECMKRGAFDYVEKNIPGVDVYDLLAIKVGQAMERRRTSLSTIRRLEALGMYGREKT